MLAFNDNEDEVVHSILSVLENGRRIYKLEESLLSPEIRYGDLMILPDKREVTCHGRRFLFGRFADMKKADRIDKIDRRELSDTEPAIRHKIGRTTYLVGIYFSEKGRETMQDKILRMMKNEIHGKT